MERIYHNVTIWKAFRFLQINNHCAQAWQPFIDRKLPPTRSTWDNIAIKLLKIQHMLIDLAVKRCHTYARWQTVHNFFLEKIPGNPLIDQLRVIHIYEADWNIILKYYLTHKVLQTASQKATIAPEQAGGRPGRCAIDEATKTVILYETCRLQKLTGGIMYNDAKACFDRIV
jgi:hypothetical protein